MKRIFLALILAFLSVYAVYAVQAYNQPIKVTQPDGSVLTIRVHGDEFLNWITCGNSLVAKGADGYYHFASFTPEGVSLAQGSIVRSSRSGDGSDVMPPLSAVQVALEKRQQVANAGMSSRAAASVTGSGPYLVMLIEFSDIKFTINGANTAFSNMLSQVGYSDNGGTGSVKDYYTDNSHNKFTPTFHVVGPITVDGTMASYSANDGTTANGAPRLLKEACEKVDAQVDFSKYDLDNDGYIDNVFFYFAGHNAAEGAEGTIWPHQSYVNYYHEVKLDGKSLGRYSCSSELKSSSGSTMAGIGTFCHEFGHSIGLPDFYDTDYEVHGEGLALDNLSLMSSGNYNNDGRTPPYLTYEERHILGWDDGLILLQEGANTLLPMSGNKAYYCPTGIDGEYYLFESRPTTGWDAYTKNKGGMAVYHVDKSDFVLPDGTTAASKWRKGYGINIFASHQCMDLVESVAPESSVSYDSENVFPGYHRVTQLDATTTPALLAWNGQPTGYSLSGISFDSTTGNSSLTVSVSRQITGRVTSLNGVPLAGVEMTITPVENQVSAASSRSAVGSLQVYAPVSRAGASPMKATTDANGAFLIPVSSGDYRVSTRKEGYAPYSCSVTVDVSKNLNILLPTVVEGGDKVLKKYEEPFDGRAFGFCQGGLDYYAGVRFSSSELTDYVGRDISSVSFIADNGGDGTVLEMGVKVFFDGEEVCSRAAAVPVFGTMCTVDISDAKLTIPEGKSVLFAYYLYGPSYDYPIAITDYGNHVSDAGLYLVFYRGMWNPSASWSDYSYGNVVVSATISDAGKVISLAGFNMISTQSEYVAGQPITLQLAQNPNNPPASTTWKVDGEAVEGNEVTLPAGSHIVRAYLTYPSGRTECVETSIQVK